MANVRIRHRSATYTEWFTANPILSVREIAYEHPDTGIGTGPVKSKQGDGVTPWNNLPYSTPTGGGGSGTNEVILTEDKTKKFYIAGTESDITNTGNLNFNNGFYIDQYEGLKANLITSNRISFNTYTDDPWNTFNNIQINHTGTGHGIYINSEANPLGTLNASNCINITQKDKSDGILITQWYNNNVGIKINNRGSSAGLQIINMDKLSIGTTYGILVGATVKGTVGIQVSGNTTGINIVGSADTYEQIIGIKIDQRNNNVNSSSININNEFTGYGIFATAKGYSTGLFIDTLGDKGSTGIKVRLQGSNVNNGIYVENTSSGATGIIIRSTSTLSKSLWIINESAGIGQLIENNYTATNNINTTIGLSVVNKSVGTGIVITNQVGLAVGLQIICNNGSKAMTVDVTNDTGKGIFINCITAATTAISTNGTGKFYYIDTNSILNSSNPSESNSQINILSTGIQIISGEGYGVSVISNSLSPDLDARVDLGSAELRWNNIYAASSTISTSDKNKKKNIKVITSKSAKSIINGLNPVTYEYKDGTSGRRHYGLLAQDVEELITKLGISDKGFGALVKSPKYNEDGTIDGYDYGLRYEEFISILVKELQNQNKELNDLKKEIKSIKEFIKM